VMQRSNLTSADLRAALQREGVGMEQYRAQVQSQLERGELIERNVKKKVHITSEDLQRYYQANGGKYTSSGKIHLRHILLTVPDGATTEEDEAVLARIVELRKQAVEGASFSKLARENSQGAGAADGGDIGWVERGTLLDQLADVAFKLSDGEIYPVLKTKGLEILDTGDLDAFLKFSDSLGMGERAKQDEHYLRKVFYLYQELIFKHDFEKALQLTKRYHIAQQKRLEPVRTLIEELLTKGNDDRALELMKQFSLRNRHIRSSLMKTYLRRTESNAGQGSGFRDKFGMGVSDVGFLRWFFTEIIHLPFMR